MISKNVTSSTNLISKLQAFIVEKKEYFTALAH